MRTHLPVKFHQKLIDEGLMILLFGVDKLPSDSSKEIKILHKYDYRSLNRYNE